MSSSRGIFYVSCSGGILMCRVAGVFLCVV